MEATVEQDPFAEPQRYVGVDAGHGFIFRGSDRLLYLEHCQDGHWGACIIAGKETTDRREGRKAAMRHLRHAAHRFDAPQQLAGTHHAGGGNGIKGPAR